MLTWFNMPLKKKSSNRSSYTTADRLLYYTHSLKDLPFLSKHRHAIGGNVFHLSFQRDQGKSLRFSFAIYPTDLSKIFRAGNAGFAALPAGRNMLSCGGHHC